MLTESSKMFEALKSLYITGFSASWRKATPFAAPTAIFILVDHGSDTEYPVKSNINPYSVKRKKSNGIHGIKQIIYLSYK